jgi:hypothetical protein
MLGRFTTKALKILSLKLTGEKFNRGLIKEAMMDGILEKLQAQAARLLAAS